MTSLPNLDQMTPEQMRALAEQAMQLLSQVDSMGQKIHRLEKVNELLSHEIAMLKRHKFAKRSEQLSPDQGNLLDDLLDTDIAAIEAELMAANSPAAPAEPRQQPKRAPLPPQFPRTVIHHEPETPSAPVAANFSALARTSARSWITRRACSPSSSTCVGNGPAASAKH